MAIDPRFLMNAKDRLDAVRRAGVQFRETNPRLSFGAAGAMLLAPAIFKNDNRGYFQTAAVTTPLIAAGTYALPSVLAPFRSQFSKHYAKTTTQSVAEAWTRAKATGAATLEDIRKTTQDYASGSTPMDVMQDVSRRHFTGRMGKAKNLTAERSALQGHLDKLFDPMKTLSVHQLDYISNAIHAEKMHSLSASELLAYQNTIGGKGTTVLEQALTGGSELLSPIAPQLEVGAMKGAIMAHMDNLKFVRGMRYRLAKMNRLTFTGERTVMPEAETSMRATRVGYSEEVMDQLKATRPDLAAELKEFVHKPGFDPSKLKFSVLEEPGHPIAALHYGKRLTVPIIRADGTVLIGKNLRRTAVAQKVYTKDHMMASDVYAVMSMNRNISSAVIAKELQRANIIAGVEPGEWTTSTLGEGATVVDTPGAKFVRERTAIPSHAWGFGDEANTVGWNKLDAEASTQATIDAARKHGLTAMGPEAGVYKGKLQMAELESLAAFGRPSVEKQSPTIRAITKNVSFTKVPDYPTGPRPYLPIRDKLNVPFSGTDYLETVAPHIDQRGMAMRVAGVTGGEKTLFGDLPETVEGLAKYQAKAIDIIAKERGVSTIEARKAWMEMSNWLSHPKNLQAMRKLGTLGEGGIIMPNDLNSMGVEQTVRYKVHEPMVGDWKSYIGQSVEERFGGDNVLLGMYGANPVTAGGTKNYVQNIHNMGLDPSGNPLYELEMREWHPLSTGAKVDVGGIKGLVSGMDKGSFERLRTGLNKWYSAIGSGGYIPREATGVSVLHYSQNKREPIQALMDVAGDTMRRLEETGELEKIRPHLDLLAEQGITYEGGRLKVPTKDDFLHQSFTTVEEMFKDVSDRLRNGQIQGDQFMQRYAMSHNLKAVTAGEESYAQYAYHHAAPAWTQAWDSTRINVPTETKVTYDMLQQLSLKGYYGAMEDIQSRVGYEGDVRMNRQMEQYLNGETSAITKTLKLEEGLNEAGFLKRMSTPEGRANTFFDEGFEPAKQNYLMELPDGTKVPVLGHEAYGGKTNRFGATFSASDHEKKLMSLMRMYQDGGTPSARAVDKAKGEYIDEIKKFVIGKQSYLRADAVDETAGIGQFIQTRASTLRYADTGEVNPFEIGISPDMIRKINDRDLQKRLRMGMYELPEGAEGPKAPDVYAFITRHPVSDMPAVKVRVDRSLKGSNIIGIDEGLRGMLMADDDKDMIWAFFMRRQMQGHEEAAKAVAGIEDQGQRQMASWLRQMGNEDDPRQLLGTGKMNLKNLFGMLQDKQGDWKPLRSLDEALRARSTAGSIGAFSNTLTEMLMGLENNTRITATGDKRTLARYMFDVVRQGPISAGKLKFADKAAETGRRPMEKARALGINKDLSEGMAEGGERGFNRWIGALQELADASTGADANNITPVRAILDTHKETLFRPYFEGISDRQGIRQATRAITMSKEAASRAKSFGIDPNLMSYIQAAATDTPVAEELPSVVGKAANVGAKVSAEAIGAWNRMMTATRQAGGAIRKNKVGLVLGAGVAIAAAAGIATGNMDRQPLRSSANEFQAEDRAGVSDQAPGGAWEGTRASRPRRNMVQSAPQMRTAMVAPIQETADMDVRIRAKDRSRAHETAKIMSQMATRGDSNVTINYSGQKRRSLRSREKLRVAMEED